MAVDARTSHCQTVHVLMLICCLPKQGKSLGILTRNIKQNDLTSIRVSVSLTLPEQQEIQSSGHHHTETR